MEFADIIRRRRMVRRFADRGIPDEALAAIVDAAVRSPTAGFTQGVSFLVLTGADVPSYWEVTAGSVRPGRAAEPNAWLNGLRAAPVLVLVWTSEQDYLDRYARPDKGWTDRDPTRWSAPYWWVDAGMAAMAALLATVDRGLGACFFGVPPDRVAAVRSAFAVPPEQASVGVIALGHPEPGVAARPRPRRQVVHRGRWTS